jgi:acetylornithine/N-succinyldiaminopimelate aminotransferase
VRGAGLLLGAVLNENYQNRAKEFLLASAEHGLLVLIAGANVIRFAPALNISNQEIELAMSNFKEAVKSVTLK